MKRISVFASLALLGLFVFISTGGFGKAHAQGLENNEQAIKVLDELVSSMEKSIAVAEDHKQQLLELRKVLVKGKISEKKIMILASGQDTGWLIEHPAQAIGKVYDKFKEAEKAVKEENDANERWLEKQKEEREKQEQRYRNK